MVGRTPQSAEGWAEFRVQPRSHYLSPFKVDHLRMTIPDYRYSQSAGRKDARPQGRKDARTQGRKDALRLALRSSYARISSGSCLLRRDMDSGWWAEMVHRIQKYRLFEM